MIIITQSTIDLKDFFIFIIKLLILQNIDIHVFDPFFLILFENLGIKKRCYNKQATQKDICLAIKIY